MLRDKIGSVINLNEITKINEIIENTQINYKLFSTNIKLQLNFLLDATAVEP